MTTLEQIVRQFLLHPGINLTYVAHQLYPELPKSARQKLHAKLFHTQNRVFTDAELERLYAIRKEFLSQLQ